MYNFQNLIERIGNSFYLNKISEYYFAMETPINIAIIIGVSKYADSRNNLPGSFNDAEAIKGIIDRTNKFQEILYLNNSEESGECKKRLTNFISKFHEQQIGELFFYFSGHGEFFKDEFYYLLSDFEPKKRLQTSFQNEEIDDLFKQLNPSLTIKIVDACQSGTAYIKNIDALEKYFHEGKKGFKHCYFMYSSLNNQYSYQTENISDFTKSLVNAIRIHKSNEIRYKDLIDIVTDEFSNNDDQTPFFVTQAKFTEQFCTISHELKEYVEKSPLFLVPQATFEDKPKSIAQSVIADSLKYLDNEKMKDALSSMQSRFYVIDLSNELKNLYNVQVTHHSNYEKIPNMASIINWLRRNRNEYFYSIIDEEYYDGDGNQYFLDRLKTEYPSEFNCLSIEIIRNFPNIANYRSNVVYLCNRRFVRLFYFISQYEDKGFNSSVLKREFEWVTFEGEISNDDSVEEIVSRIETEISSRIEQDIKGKLFPEETSETNAEIDSEDLPF